jgi:site-specific DNA-methyltransferase (adenine-specific)
MNNITQQNYTDILETLSHLSSDEVFTPPDVANEILDLLPEDVWTDPNIKILDPCTKSGVFLREAAKRLMIGLKDQFRNEDLLRKHIFKNMLYGVAITEITSLISKRSLYYSKDASSEFSVIQFDSKEGNIRHRRVEHDFFANKCMLCGASEGELSRDESRENYAYEFIHSDSILSEMKFDVIIGNPPYQLNDEGFGRSASPIYHLFVEQAFRLKPRYVSMIIPSRWFTGGKGLKSFRKNMLNSKNFTNLVDFPNSSEVFPNVTIRGGVSYFLWDKNYEGKCEIKTIENKKISGTSNRFLGEHGEVFIRFSEGVSVIEKIKNQESEYLENQVAARNPFGMATNFNSYRENESKGFLKLYRKKGESYVHPKFVVKNEDWIYKYKVLTLRSYGAGGNPPHYVTGKPLVVKPGEVCTETYLVCGVFDNLNDAEDFAKYLKTKFVRFLVYLNTPTQDINRGGFKFVPKYKNYKNLNDDKLFSKYKFSNEEIEFINNLIKEMDD